MLKKIEALFKVGFLLIVFQLFATSISAHVLKTDGSVGAVIHVSPEDDPIARESTDFFFELKDKTGKFKPENCDCRGIILQSGKEIYSEALFQDANPSLENASFSFTFPEKNVYKVRVSGKPTTPGAFEPFTLSWDIRVARESETQPTGQETQEKNQSKEARQPRYVLYIGFIAIAVYVVYRIIKLVKRK